MRDREKENKQIYKIELSELSFVILKYLRYLIFVFAVDLGLFVRFVTKLVISFFFLFVFKIQQ